jgi:biotin-dependent carboxylase-like uncharacterized protein
MSLQVLASGLLTTLQDGGRVGYRALGVGSSGAADRYSLQLANRLLGNRPDEAALEITLAGPTLRFERAVRIALCGGDIDARCDDIALPGWRPLALPAGSELRLGPVRRGCRSYLAVGGGFALEPVLGSRSTDLRGGFGGCQGRALQAGDRLALGADPIAADPARPQIAAWSIDPRPDLDFDADCLLQVLPGIDPTRPADRLLQGEWTVEAASNRQGLRLRGIALTPESAHERVSSPVLPGTVQLPPDGQPIVLLADAQTVGGYPRIGQLAAADLPRAAQLRPGDRLRFAACSAEQAWQRLRAQQQRLARLEIALAARRAQDMASTRYARTIHESPR